MARVRLPAASLSMVDFGAPAAERDIERGLEGYFVESEAYNRVRTGAKRILIGGRGIGKSAIFQILARRERDAGSFVIELAPEDYSYELLTQTMASQSNGSWAKHGAYAAAWKYLLYVLIMKEIAARRVRLPKGTGGQIYKYIRDNHVNHEASRLASLVSYLKRMEGIKIGPYEASMRARELEKLYKLEEINHLLPVLRDVAASRRVIVLVDELDRGWDSSEDARAFVAGLFQACISVNSVHDNLRVYVSLRQELYEDIPELYDDAQKYRDLIETVRWSRDSLLTLIANRIRHSIPALAGHGDQDCWDALFGKGPGSETFPYMVDRTLYRPREIIQFCVQALEHARDCGTPVPLSPVTVREAEYPYSRERAKDIAAEYRFQYPGLLSVIEAFRGRGSVLTRDDLELACLELITREVPTRGTQGWLDDCTPDSLIDILWGTGFLGAEAAQATAPLRARAGPFVGPHQGDHLAVTVARRFQIHPMFWTYLGTQASR
ncbi:MAG TPA: hypothetical protein VFO01_05780 [Trebonia sp.]|nr:hypothetical protein [Trebonia sp.]